MASSNLTMAVLGCGTMGIAILNGVLTSLHEPKPLPTPSPSGDSTPAEELLPHVLPSRFIACVRSAESAERVTVALKKHSSVVSVVRNGNVKAVTQAHVVLLACKPYMVDKVLGEPGMVEALRGKLLISICAGISVEHLSKALYGPGHDPGESCRFVRAMCNTAALIRESMTVIGISDPPLSPEDKTLVTWIFKRVGDVIHLPDSAMDATTAVVGSAPAMFSLMLEAAVDGAVAMGLTRVDAQRMATQAMRGATGLIQAGEHPTRLREKVSTPGGCTIGGLLVLEEGGVRGAVSRAIRETTCIASQLGKGVQGVNGTRPPLKD